jgi:hypothetical protein
MEIMEKNTVQTIMMGAIQAHRDFKTVDDLDVDQHRCTGSKEYCTGYNRGYSDEEDFLG